MICHGIIIENNSQENDIFRPTLTNILLSVSMVIDLELFLSPGSIIHFLRISRDGRNLQAVSWKYQTGTPWGNTLS